MHQASVAAVTLALTMVVAAIGTIQQVDASAGPCAAPCSGEALVPDGWEASLHRTLVRTEHGLLQMAGMAPAR